jgi:hypothetical protein
MSFFVAGCVLLLALLAGIAILGEAGVRGGPKARRDARPFDGWWW